MNDDGAAGLIPIERRQALLARIPGFAGVSAGQLAELAASLREETFFLERVIVTEGESGDRLYLIESDRAEVTTAEALLTAKYLKKKNPHAK